MSISIRSKKTMFVIGGALFMAGLGMVGWAPNAMAADTYPNRHITLVVAYAAGGGSDSVARSFGKELSEKLGQPVVVQNSGGAGGAIGAQKVVNSEPDGYTLLLGTTSEIMITPKINSAAKYTPVKDMTMLGVIGFDPMILVATKSSKISTPAQYLKAVRDAVPNTYRYGSSGVGSMAHLTGEVVNRATSSAVLQIPYRGAAPMLADILGGQVDFGYLTLSSGLPQVKSGKVNGIGVTSAHRAKSAPDIPALAENEGFHGVDLKIWFGLFGPQGLPKDVFAKLQSALQEVLRDLSFVKQMDASGTEIASTTIDPAVFLKQENAKYDGIVRDAAIPVN